MLGFWVDVGLFVAIAWLLVRYYTPGTDAPSDDEVGIREWNLVRFLRYGRDAAPQLPALVRSLVVSGAAKGDL